MFIGDVPSGILVGAAGGAFAGLVLWLITRLNEYEKELREGRRILKWLDAVTGPEDATNWRSTRAIASYNNLSEERVRYLCSHHKGIVLSTGEKELWGIKGRARDEKKTGVVRG